MLIARPRYSYSPRDALAGLIADCLDRGLEIPDDLPVDTDDHVLSAIIYLTRRYRGRLS